MRNADGWGLAFIVFGTAGVIWSLPAEAPRGAVAAVQGPAIDAPATDVAYKITVSTARIPAECKTLSESSSSDVVAGCQSLTTRETQMTMVPVDETVQVAIKP